MATSITSGVTASSLTRPKTPFWIFALSVWELTTVGENGTRMPWAQLKADVFSSSLSRSDTAGPV